LLPADMEFLVEEAADEIERLNLRLNDAEVEVIELRAALERIVQYEREDDVPEMHMWDIASEALKDQ